LIPNPIKTQAAKDAASAAVPQQYDYTTSDAETIASAQLTKLRDTLAPIDAVYALNQPAASRDAALQAILPASLPSLSTTESSILIGLDASGWHAVESAAETALTKGEATELRDTDLAIRKLTLASEYMPKV
jgi:hypothetical protein